MNDKTKPEMAAEPKADKAPADPLLACLEGWCRQFAARDAARRLRAELAAEGITTTDALARASIATVAQVLRATLRLDAQSLTATAQKEQKEHG